MKNLLLILGIFILPITSIYSQCEIKPYIQNNYEFDAKLLALRDILSDPSDPDHFNPYIPEARFTPYLEKLSAIYNNPNNEPEIDAIFNDFQIHTNQEYNHPIELKTIALNVDTNVSWVEGFKNTGISGVPALDQLILDYQFSLDSFWDLNGITIFFIKTEIEFLNLNAIIGDFENIQDLNSSEIYYDIIDLRFNYTGIPYQINNENVAVADIIIENDVFTFSLYSGDCFAGCMYSESWSVQVTEDCQVELLSNESNSISNFTIFPNPSSDIINISGITDEEFSIKIYNLQGQILKSISSKTNQIDITFLTSGVYFIKIQTEDNKTIIKRFIKK